MGIGPALPPYKYPLGVVLAQNSRGLVWLPTRGSGQKGAPSWLEFCRWQAVGPGLLLPGVVKAGSRGGRPRRPSLTASP